MLMAMSSPWSGAAGDASTASQGQHARATLPNPDGQVPGGYLGEPGVPPQHAQLWATFYPGQRSHHQDKCDDGHERRERAEMCGPKGSSPLVRKNHQEAVSNPIRRVTAPLMAIETTLRRTNVAAWWLIARWLVAGCWLLATM